MRPRKCREKCPYCGKNDETKIASSTQFYCKRCNRYFKKGTTRKEYSRETLIAIRTIVEMFYGSIPKKGITIKKFVSNILKNLDSTIHNLKIHSFKIPKFKSSREFNRCKVNGKWCKSIIITRDSDGFFIIRGLEMGQKIIFDDAQITAVKRFRQ